jgi:thioesterase domain-containing protein
MHFFEANQLGMFNKVDWLKYCKKSIKFYKIEGDHFSILKRPVVFELVKEFEKFLKRVL